MGAVGDVGAAETAVDDGQTGKIAVESRPSADGRTANKQEAMFGRRIGGVRVLIGGNFLFPFAEIMVGGAAGSER